MTPELARRQRRDEQQKEQLHDREHDREDEHDEAEERLAVADQHGDGREERVLARPEHELRELDDRQGEAERQADGGGDDGEAQEKAPATEAHASAPTKCGERPAGYPSLTEIRGGGKTRASCAEIAVPPAGQLRLSPRGSGRQLGAVVGDALRSSSCCSSPASEHLADDVAAADELALDVELRDGRPVGEALDALADAHVLEHVDVRVVDAEVRRGSARPGMEKPHCGIVFVPFMNSTTSFCATVLRIQSWTSCCGVMGMSFRMLLARCEAEPDRSGGFV